MVAEGVMDESTMDTVKHTGATLVLFGGIGSVMASQVSPVLSSAMKELSGRISRKRNTITTRRKTVRYELLSESYPLLLPKFPSARLRGNGRASVRLHEGRVQSNISFEPISKARMYLGHAFEHDITRHIVAGTLARTVAQCVIHPLDTLKTRMQVSQPSRRLSRWKKAMLANPFRAARRPMDFMTGFNGALYGTVPVAFLYFMTYEWVHEKMRNIIPERYASASHVLAASTGALASSVIRVPADTARHQVQAYMQGNFFQALKNIVVHHGPMGLYRGFFPTVLRDVPEIAVQFTAYECLRHVLQKRGGHEKLQTYEHLLLGGVAGALAACFTMPMDYVKTVQQTGSGSSTLFGTVRAVVSEEGVKGLFRGLSPRLVQTTLMSALFFGLFEYSKLVLKPERTTGDRLVLPKIYRKRRNHVWKRQFVYRN